MSDEALALPLVRLPAPSRSALVVLCEELEATIAREQRGPWMVLGGTARERLGVVRPGLDPGSCARVEAALRAEPGVLWTALCGDAWLPAPGGALRYAFVRMLRADRSWSVNLRSFLPGFGEILYLDDWTQVEGEVLPEGRLRLLFPQPDPGPVRFVSSVGPLPPPNDVQPLPAGCSPEDVARMAGLWLESFFFSRGFVPPAAVAVTGDRMRVYLLPRTGPAHAASDLAVRLAQEPEVLAVGVFLRDRDARIQPPAEQIGLRMEWRGGPGLLWRRRFRLVAANTARWLDAQGEVTAGRSRRLWFPEP